MSLLDHLKPPVRLERREVGILALFAVVGFTQGWAGAAITHALPFLQEDLGLSDARIFDILAIVRAVALLALAFSWWGDHKGRRRPVLIAFAFLTGGNLLTFLLPSTGGFAAGQAVTRIGGVALGALAIVVLAEEVNPRLRSYAIAVYALVGAMGTGFGLLLRPLGQDGGDWRLLFALSAIPLVALPILALRLKESRAFTPVAKRLPLAAVLHGEHARRFWPMAVLSFALSAFTSPAANLALVRLENDLGWSTASASLMLAVTSAPAVVIGLLAGGRLADRVGRRPTEAITIVIGVAGGIAFYQLEISWLLTIGIFFSMLGAFGFSPAFASHRSELFPTELRATATAWIVNAAILGGLTGFTAGRFLVDAWGVSATITVLGILLLLAALVIPTLPETKGLSLTEGAKDHPELPDATPM